MLVVLFRIDTKPEHWVIVIKHLTGIVKFLFKGNDGLLRVGVNGFFIG